MKLHNEIVPVAAVSPSDRDTLFALYSRYYSGARRDQFENDMAEKDVVILLRDRSHQQVCGFSTQMILRQRFGGREVRALFSGDTIIAPSHWGDQELRRGWCRYAAAALTAEPGVPLYWFLMTKGYRTYLYLPVFFRDFFPHYDRETPRELQSLLDGFARQKFGDAYDASSGLIRFTETHGQLVEELSGVPERRAHDPHVKFFLQHNPGYVNGVELACITEISHENIRPFARHMFWEEQRSVVVESPELRPNA
ncbi:MAG: hypothetical protein ABSD75_07800 [Terriglobales bacterium]|jgi:hypothetical protein